MHIKPTFSIDAMYDPSRVSSDIVLLSPGKQKQYFDDLHVRGREVYGKIGSRRKVERTHRFPFVLRSWSVVSLFLPVNFSDPMTFVWASEPSSARKARWKGTVLRRSSRFACQCLRSEVIK